MCKVSVVTFSLLVIVYNLLKSQSTIDCSPAAKVIFFYSNVKEQILKQPDLSKIPFYFKLIVDE